MLIAGPKSVCLGNGRRLIALRRLLLMPFSTPLRIVDHCRSGFPVFSHVCFVLSVPVQVIDWKDSSPK